MGSPPDPTTFDPNADGLPDALSSSRLPAGGAGRVVVMLATGEPDSEAWARDAAVSVARSWAEDGARVFLADAALTDPHLHEVLGLPNEEGVADMFRFGASVQRVARRIEDLPFFFTSAGTTTFNPHEVLASSRWRTLADGFRDAGAALLLYLPASEPGADGLLAQATDVVVFGEEVPDSLAADSAPTVVAWVTGDGGPAEGVPPEADFAAEAVETTEPVEAVADTLEGEVVGEASEPKAPESTLDADLVVVPEEDTLDPWGLSREAASELEPDSTPSPWTDLEEGEDEVLLPDMGLSLDETVVVDREDVVEAPPPAETEVEAHPEEELAAAAAATTESVTTDLRHRRSRCIRGRRRR